MGTAEERCQEKSTLERLNYLRGGSNRDMGREGFEPSKTYSQQIYSLPRLATSVPTRNSMPVRRRGRWD
jgi:hypothetical protein